MRSLTLDTFEDPPRTSLAPAFLGPPGWTKDKAQKRACDVVYRQRRRAIIIEQRRSYYLKNRERILKESKLHYAQNAEDIRAKRRPYNAAQIPIEREKCFAAYGGPVCHHCGFSDWRALSIDHVNGGGAEHRSRKTGAGRSGWGFYQYLRKQGYPPGYQVLCMNCQFIKRWTNKENTRHKGVPS
jgi:hypothetical protein